MLDYIFDSKRYNIIDSEDHNSPMTPIANQAAAGLFAEWCNNRKFSDSERIIKYIERADKSTTLGRSIGLPFGSNEILKNLVPTLKDAELRNKISTSISLGFEDKQDLTHLLLSVTTESIPDMPLPDLDLNI